jgi:hypothetical protein
MIPIEQLTHTHFEPLVGQCFTCIPGEAALKLVESIPVGRPIPGSSRIPFAIRFTGQPSLRLPQSIYRLENPALGALEIFLVQTGADKEASHFEANFN